jgi:putative CocE/NonD family hydrolase
MTGDAVAHLFASTTGTDTDWVVQLIDVYPDDYEANEALRGYQYMVAGEVFRARYRNSCLIAEPVPSNEVVEHTIHLRDRSHTFKRGHRIAVQIQSIWFPLIDRNPQSWVPSIYEATEGDFTSATQRVYRTGESPTRITLPLRTGAGS